MIGIIEDEELCLLTLLGAEFLDDLTEDHGSLLSEVLQSGDSLPECRRRLGLDKRVEASFADG